MFLRAPCEVQIGQRFRVHRKEAHRGAVFGRHVGDGGAIRDAQTGQARAVKLNKLADDALLPQHFRDRQNKVRRGGAFAKSPMEPEANHFRNEH